MVGFIKCDKSGFTLIEITIALLLLAVGLVGILTLFPVGFDASLRAANITEATFLAQGLMEDLKREGYSGTRLVNALSATQSGDFTTDGYPNYEYGIDAVDVSSLRETTVIVYWPAGAADQRSVELKTYIVDYEP